MCVVKIDATLVFIIEGRWTISVALIFLLILLQGVQCIALFFFSLRSGNFNFSFGYLIGQTFCTSLLCLVRRIRSIFGLFFCSVLLFCSLSVLRAEVDELFTKVDFSLVWVFVKLIKLLLVPLPLLLSLLLSALFLSRLVLVILLLALFGHLFTRIIALLALLVVFLLTLRFLLDHLLGLTDPFDVLDESLLDLVVTHSSIEVFLDLPLFISQIAGLLHNFVDLHTDVGQVVLLQLLVLIEDRFFRLNLVDTLLQRVDNLISWRHLLLDLLFLLLLLCNLSS